MQCLAHKLVNSGKNIFTDVSAAQVIEEQLFDPLKFGVLVDLDILKNVFMLD